MPGVASARGRVGAGWDHGAVSADQPSGSTPPGPAGDIARFAIGLTVLAVIVLALLAFFRFVSFAPGAPEVDRSTLPRIDPAVALRSASAGVDFPLRLPALPPEWISQSSDVVPLGAPGDAATGRAVRVGWVTAQDRFARLVQSDGDDAALVGVENGEPVAQGTVTAGGRQWVVYPGIREEQIWITDVDGVRLLVTGDAAPPELRQLAEAAVAAPPSL